MSARSSCLAKPESCYLARESASHIAEAQPRDQATQRLVDWPDFGRTRDELHPGIRSGQRQDLRWITPKTIEIVRAPHGRRDINAIFAQPR